MVNMASQLEQELNEEQQPSKFSRLRHAPKSCPQFCPIFECVIGDNCKEECRNLEMVKGTICDLCIHDSTCSKKRRMALLDLEYFNNVKKLQKDETSSRIEELKAQHRHFELSYKDLKEQAIDVGALSFGQKAAIQQQGLYFRTKIEQYREVMDILKISYKVDVKLGDSTHEPSALRKNIVWIVLISTLLTIYVAVTVF